MSSERKLMKILWIKDSKAGHLNKARGLFRAMGQLAELDIVEYELVWRLPAVRQILSRIGNLGLNIPARWFLRGLPRFDGIDLVLSAGGATQWANAAIAKQQGLMNVFLGSLRQMDADGFSLVASHDSPSNEGRFFRFEIIPSLYTPDSHTDEAGEFNAEHGKVWGLVIGGDGEGYRWKKRDYQQLCEVFVSQASKSGVGVWIATSRRTPPDAEQSIRKMAMESGISIANSFYHGRDGLTKPLGVMMAACSRLCVTADSMSMTHEAVSTGTQVFVVSPGEGGNPRLAGNLKRLEESGFVVLQGLDTLDVSDAEPTSGWKRLCGDPTMPLAERVLGLFGKEGLAS
jgi:uncharacterized protein